MKRKIGMWLIGAHGGVSTTVAVGLVSLANQRTQPFGLVSSLPPFHHLDLLDWSDIVIGGHEIRQTCYLAEARQLAASRVLDPMLVEAAERELLAMNRRIRPGVLLNVGPTICGIASSEFSNSPNSPADAIAQIEDDLKAFVAENELDQCVVVNLASTEPPVEAAIFPETWAELSVQLSETTCQLPASSAYAIAAFQLGMPFVNFTPSLGNHLPAIEDLAIQQHTCHAGKDGKTGETFLKSVLAPAFGQRHLEIMSWVGHNIFGNMDGQILDDPANKETKVVSKDRLLGQILGYDPQTHISIEYIQSLGDWKTAWDHIHFRGFMGTPMILQFTWQGCDSILAAPLVLDLVRFTELAQRGGECGVLTWLASFFKSPLGTTENDFAKQFKLLTEWAEQFTGAKTAT